MSGFGWFFDRILPQGKKREPMHSKFFESDNSISTSLIREAIQNSLDARIDLNNPVGIRIYLSNDNGALQPEKARFYFTEELWNHLNAKNNGLQDCPDRNQPCKYVVIEDFNTSGLNGNLIEYSEPEEKDSNPFYYFFRAEGQSGKHDSDRGRHGIGKIVFPKASNIKAFFGLSVRSEDNQKIFFGQCLLRSHKVNSEDFTSDGWYAKQIPIQNDYIPVPLDDNGHSDEITRFCNDFHLARSSEPGLSLIVPFIDDDINEQSILQALISHYFWPIITGELYVDIATPDNNTRIESGSIEAILNSDFLSDNKELHAKIELAKWANKLPSDECLETICPVSTAAPEWSEKLVPAEIQNIIRKRLVSEENIAIKVPVYIKDKIKQVEHETYFKVFIQRHPSYSKGYPVFIRKGLIIPDEKRIPTNRSVVSLVIADEPHIADFLGNAENPSHTEWSTTSDNFKNRYTYGSKTLTFIKKSVSEIIGISEESAKQEDHNLLLDFFSIPSSDITISRPEKRKKKEDRGDRTGPPHLEIPHKPKRYRLNKINGGFTLTKGEGSLNLPAQMQIKIFYDRRDRKPKYNINDFRIEKMKPESKGLKIIQTRGNVIIAEILNCDFRLKLIGFDPNRDLLVKPSITENEGGLENATA